MAKKSALSMLYDEVNDNQPKPAQAAQTERKTRESLPGNGKEEVTEFVTAYLQEKLLAKKESREPEYPETPEGLNMQDNPVTGLKVWGYSSRTSKHDAQTVKVAVIRTQFYLGAVKELPIRECQVNTLTGEMEIVETLENTEE